MPEAKSPEKRPSRSRRLPPKRRRFVDAAWGAASGAAVGGIGVLLMTASSPPVLVAMGVLAAAGAVCGYVWGDQVHGAIWSAIFRTPGGGH